MDTSLLLIVLAVAAVAALLWKRQQGTATRQSIKDSDKPWPFAARSVLTEREREMFRTLQEALHPHYIVLSQVDMKQVLRIKDRRNERRWRGVIAQKSLDFVVCDYDTTVIAVIELDDKSHQRADRQRSDADKERALKDAGIKFWRLRNVPSVHQVQKIFGLYRPATAEMATA